MQKAKPNDKTEETYDDDDDVPYYIQDNKQPLGKISLNFTIIPQRLNLLQAVTNYKNCIDSRARRRKKATLF